MNFTQLSHMQPNQAEKELIDELVNTTPHIRDFDSSFENKARELYNNNFDVDVRWPLVLLKANDILYEKTRYNNTEEDSL